MENVSITLSGEGLQDVQKLNINITVVATVNVDAKTAHKRATLWLINEVGNMLFGGAPDLVISNQTLWRVPVIASSSEVDRHDQVGVVDVNATSGELLVSDQLREQIINNVHHLDRSTSTSDS